MKKEQTLPKHNLTKDEVESIIEDQYGLKKLKQEYKEADVELKRNKVDEIRLKNRRRMAWLSMWSILIVTCLAFFVVPDAKIKVLSEVITWFYIIMGMVISAYFGVTTFIDKIKGTDNDRLR